MCSTLNKWLIYKKICYAINFKILILSSQYWVFKWSHMFYFMLNIGISSDLILCDNHFSNQVSRNSYKEVSL